MNYYAILLNPRKKYLENDSFDLTFQIYSEQNDLQATLTAFKFACKITNDADTLTKKDVNYSGGSATQISVSGDKVTVHVVDDDTDSFYGDYVIEFQLENISTGFKQTVYREFISIIEEELDV